MTATLYRPSTAAASAARRERTLSRLEDLEFLLSAGEAPGRALERIGWTPGAAQRAAHRYGRPDLGQAVGPVLYAHRVATGQRVLVHA